VIDRPEQNGRPDEPDRVVIRDKRKIDPVTGEARPDLTPPATGAEPATEPAGESGQVPMVEAALFDERTRDLQRVQAEYANYRKRTERDRLVAGEVAISRVLAELLPVLDDIDRARAHGDLGGALKAVADHLDTTLTKLGLVAFGEEGDRFDPAIHEAVLHNESDEVTEPTCTTVMRQGYRHGERLLRAAMVGVTEPATQVATATTTATTRPEGDQSAAGDTQQAEGDPATQGDQGTGS
jgi:molecular chaperone GrpE